MKRGNLSRPATRAMWAIAVAASMAFAGGIAEAMAQATPLRGGTVGDPRVGQEAPDFALPYVTAAGRGPDDQPFRLRAELGRVVVLVFANTPGDSSTAAVWRYLASNDSTVFHPATVVIGLFRTGHAPVESWAASLAGRYKFLPDSLGKAFRRFGVVGNRSQGVSVFVVGYDGRLVFRSRSFQVSDAVDVERLKKAVREGAS